MLLSEYIDQRKGSRERMITSEIGELKFSQDGLEVPGVDHPIVMDALAIEKVTELLGVKSTYLTKKAPLDLLIQNLDYWKRERAHQQGAFTILDDELVMAHDPNRHIISDNQILNRLSKVMPKDAEVVSLGAGKKFQEVSVTSPTFTTTVPNRQLEQDDITHAGIRLFTYPGREAAPSIQTYMNRLVCTNGLVIPEVDAAISLKGNTVAEVLDDLEVKADLILGRLDDRLNEYKSTHKIKVPGSAEAFIHRVAQERGTSARIEGRILDRAGELPDSPSLYDVLNLFTSVANDVRSATQKYRLQKTGGVMVTDAEHMVHRCNSCEQLLH